MQAKIHFPKMHFPCLFGFLLVCLWFSTTSRSGEHLNTAVFAAILDAVNEPVNFGGNSWPEYYHELSRGQTEKAIIDYHVEHVQSKW